MLDYTDSVIIVEVIQQMQDFSVDLITEPGTPEGNLAEKLEVSGEQPYKPEFTSFQVAVKKGVGKEQEGSYSFTRYGTYYVVEDDYVLSAFEGQTEEMKAFSRETNGYKLNLLIAEIKALKGN